MRLIRFTRIFLLFIISITFWHTALRAQSFIGLYNFTGAAGNEDTWPAAIQPPNTQLSPMGRGPGISPGPAANAFAAFGWTQQTTPDPNDYFFFTITMNAGYDLRLDSITISERRSATGPRKFVVRTSRDNYTNNIKQFDLPDNTNTRNNQTTPFGTAFGLIESSTSLQIRFLAYESSAPAGTWRIDSVRIYGEILTAPTKIKWANTAINLQAGATQAVGEILIQDGIGSGTVRVVRTGGTAIEGVDFTLPPSNEVSIAGTQATYTITLLNNPAATGNESIELRLRNPSISNSKILADSILTIKFNIPNLPNYTIGQVRGTNSFEGGGPDSMNVRCRLHGTIYGVNLRASNNGLQYTLRDATGGISIFKANENFGITLTEGDSVRIVGKVNHFNGLAQIDLDSVTKIGTASYLASPRKVNTLDEDTESDLVFVEGRWLNHTQWPANPTGGGFTMKFITETDTIDIRIDNDVQLFNQPNPIPSNTQLMRIIGLGGQFAPNIPRDYGYQLLPRRPSDISPIAHTQPTSQAINKVMLYPNPTTGKIYIDGVQAVSYELIDVLGRIQATGNIDERQVIDISIATAGVYQCKIRLINGTSVIHKVLKK